jgi:hypothetical protein
VQNFKQLGKRAQDCQNLAKTVLAIQNLAMLFSEALGEDYSFFLIKGFYYLVLSKYTRPLHNKMHTAVQSSGSR